MRAGATDVVAVDRGPVREREDRARVRVHDDRRRSLGRVGGADAGEHVLDLSLEGRVERQLDPLAGDGGMDIVDRDRLAVYVADHAALATAAAQDVVVEVLEPAQALVLVADPSDNLRGQRVLGVIASLLGDRRVDAGKVEPHDRLRLARRDVVGQIDKSALLGQVSQDLGLRHAEQRGDALRDLERIPDQERVRGDVVRGFGDRELGSARVGDRAAHGGDGNGRDLLRRRVGP